jgi:hypothetical protein
MLQGLSLAFLFVPYGDWGASPVTPMQRLQTDHQATVDKLPWRFSKEKASIEDALFCYQGDDEIELVRKPGLNAGMFLRFTAEGKQPYTLPINTKSVFRQYRGQHVLYAAIYSPTSQGCELVAFDRKQHKELWRTRLRGLPPVNHSYYSNLVNLDLQGELAIVYGNEEYGQYIEAVEVKSGKTVGHKIVKMGWGK